LIAARIQVRRRAHSSSPSSEAAISVGILMTINVSDARRRERGPLDPRQVPRPAAHAPSSGRGGHQRGGPSCELNRGADRRDARAAVARRDLRRLMSDPAAIVNSYSTALAVQSYLTRTTAARTRWSTRLRLRDRHQRGAAASTSSTAEARISSSASGGWSRR